MSGRVSIKGKGEDIFFGDDLGEKRGNERAEGESPTRSNRDVTTSRRQDVGESTNEAGHERVRHDSIKEPRDDVSDFFNEMTLPDGLRRRINSVLREDHRFQTTVRLSTADRDVLTDLMYELETKVGVRVPRSEVFRIAWRLLMEDYAVRKKKSLLVQILLGEEGQY